MTDKRFHFGYVLGDTGLIDEEAENKWFIENCCNVSDLKKNWVIICEKLNELHEENQGLKNDCGILVQSNQDYRKENEQLQEKNKRLEEKIQRERTSFTKTHERWSKEAETKIKELQNENEQLKQKIEKQKKYQIKLESKIHRMREQLREFNK